MILGRLIALIFSIGILHAERPNIVWIVSDDLSPDLGCYGYPGVKTPHLDRIAKEGMRYNKAYSTSPVCSASRTAFQTGVYQTTLGGHHHDTRIMPKLPATTPTITEVMQKAGYFVSNGRGLEKAGSRLAKSHLNFVYNKKTFFDGHDWSQRADGQPFFAQIQLKEPHRVFVTTNEKPRPEAPIPPYYPDHPVTRADWANYLASIEVLDKKVGAILDRLDKEGLAENTLVIFFGDHGRPHVRCKQWLYEGGIRVPLLIKWPAKVKAGSVLNELTSLLDLVPTTLKAAGLPLHESLQGLDLLNPDWKGHSEIYAARDRCGDAPDRIRSVRNEQFKYLRNFQPDLPYLQLSSYKKIHYPVETVMKVLHARGEWTSPFMAKTRPKEELYDLAADPHELNNLAADPAHAKTLAELRDKIDHWITETKDKGAIDESKSVDMKELMAGKRKYYERAMKKRGLNPDLSDEDYLKWWEKELLSK